ncbi:MAG: hypothetical protein FJ022_08655, partial [Chloroflexi bacterium]|nr:hypothetical protein [Chloroflexota bacterium]
MGQQIKPKSPNTWRAVALFLVFIILLVGIGFSVPLVKVPVTTTETYTETEYKEEAYTVVETTPTPTAGAATNSITFFDGTLFEMGASVKPDRWGTEARFKLDIAGRTNPRVIGSWVVENFPFAVYVTIVNPNSIFVYQYKGPEASPQSHDFEFVPTVPGVYTIR